jgi:DNA-binding NtrC family response regulator
MVNEFENKAANVLFVDDEESILSTLKRSMRHTEYQCFFASSGSDALDILEDNLIDIVVSDMNMPEMNGEKLLKEVAKKYPETIRIVLSAFSDDDLVMGAINQGRIWGFIHKPWNNNDLKQALDQAIFTQKIVAERALLKRTLNQYKSKQKMNFEGFVGSSVNMQFIYNAIEKAAPSKASVFITGESGTGKEVAAKALHDLSKRSDQPFIALNCAAIPSELMESEIFGHVKGAFSGAVNHRSGAASRADGGTLFLDELSEMDITLQSKLLRFIQTGTFQPVGSNNLETVNIRFICATNREPLAAIEDKKLREDLFYRLNVISLHLPPLRERDNDVYQLSQSFLSRFNELEEKTVVGFSSDAEKLLIGYQWPGNVRQLENCIHSTIVMSNGPLITDKCIAAALNIKLDQIELNASNELESALPSTLSEKPLPKVQTTEEKIETDEIQPLSKIEEHAIKQAVDFCEGNIVRAASLLEVSPSTLYRKIQSWE